MVVAWLLVAGPAQASQCDRDGINVLELRCSHGFIATVEPKSYLARYESPHVTSRWEAFGRDFLGGDETNEKGRRFGRLGPLRVSQQIVDAGVRVTLRSVGPPTYVRFAWQGVHCPKCD